MTPHQTEVLRLLCDTVVPAIPHPDDADGFWARRATDVGADQGVLAMLAGMPAEQQQAIGGLLDVLGAQGFHAGASQESREQILTTLSLASAQAAAGIGSLTSLILLLTYGATDAAGHNPNWSRLGYPGPAGAAPPPEEPAITPLATGPGRNAPP